MKNVLLAVIALVTVSFCGQLNAKNLRARYYDGGGDYDSYLTRLYDLAHSVNGEVARFESNCDSECEEIKWLGRTIPLDPKVLEFVSLISTTKKISVLQFLREILPDAIERGVVENNADLRKEVEAMLFDASDYVVQAIGSEKEPEDKELVARVNRHLYCFFESIDVLEFSPKAALRDMFKAFGKAGLVFAGSVIIGVGCGYHFS